MGHVLITFHSRSGHTQKMAELIAEGVKQERGLGCVIADITRLKAKNLLEYKGIIGSPTYYGDMAAEVKKLLDESVKFHGQLENKIGAAFASSANIGGGGETTILSILKALLVHGMIVQGDSTGGHYGPVSIGAPDKRTRLQCLRLGGRVGQLIKRLS